jgi:hypothetical protein
MFKGNWLKHFLQIAQNLHYTYSYCDNRNLDGEATEIYHTCVHLMESKMKIQ